MSSGDRRTEAPHFFKIILSETIKEGKLGIPRKFGGTYGKGLSSPVMLRVPCGRLWQVELRKNGDEIWLEKGWSEFADYYSLEYGHFLVFRYEGNSNFYVLIFDKSASEIEYPFHANHKKPRIEQLGTDVPVEVLDDISHSGPKGTKSAQKVLDQKSRRIREKKQLMRKDEKILALNRASQFKSENPFFMKVMQPSHLCKGAELGIPAKFMREYFTEEQGNIVLGVLDGRKWSVKYSLKRFAVGERNRIRSGWNAFVNDNNLEVGDVCVFELIREVQVSLKVVIFRMSEDAHCQQQDPETLSRPEGTKATQVGLAEKSMRITETKRTLCADEKFEALKRARQFKSGNPFFLKVMQPSDLCKEAALGIPGAFMKKYFTEDQGNIFLGILDGRSWPVKYSFKEFSSGKNYRLRSGWDAFVHDNCLEIGDVCIFELIKEVQLLLNVIIFREDPHSRQLVVHGKELQGPKIEEIETDPLLNIQGRKKRKASPTKAPE